MSGYQKPFLKKLSFKQARIAVLVALVIGLCLAALQILYDASQERKRIADYGKSLASVVADSAARASYRLDIVFGQEITNGLLEYDGVVKAEIIDDFGEVLAFSKKDESKATFFALPWLLGKETIMSAIPLVLARDGRPVGRLLISVEPTLAAPDFPGRVFGQLIAGLIKSFLLTALLFVIFQITITNRIQRVVERDYPNVLDDNGQQGDELDDLDRASERTVAQAQNLISDLQATDARQKLANRSARIGVWEYNLSTEQLVWDDLMFEIYGGKREDFTGGYVDWQSRLHPLDAERAEKELNNAIDTQVGFDTAFRIITSEGLTKYIKAYADFLSDQHGNPIKMIGVNYDITELREAQDKLNHVQRLEAVGQLTGGIAHDFNNLLHVISGNSQLLDIALQDEQVDGEKARQRVAKIMGAVENASSLTGRLLAFSRRDVLSPERLPVQDTLDDVLEILKRTIGEDIDLKIEVSKDLPDLFIDKHQLGNALINLAVNARDAMPAGGILVIEAAEVALDDTFKLSGDEVLPGSYISISVIDTGHGMSKEVLEKVIDPFFTTKEVGKGSGLGLSMVYGFVQQSGGYMNIYSEPEEGTAVRLYLPIADASCAKAEAPEEPIPTELKGRILIVEDDPDVREIPVAILKEAGFEVDEADTASAALDLLEKDGGRFDILFTDIVLPGGKTGLELAKEVEALQPGISVIYTSGYTERFVNPEEGLKLGENLLRKPYQRHELLKAIDLAGHSSSLAGTVGYDG